MSDSNEVVYDRTAEFYDAASIDRVAALGDQVRRWALTVPDSAPLVDLGAGTGRLAVIAARARSSDVYVVEPSHSMRAVLANRVAEDSDLARRVSIVSSPVPDAWRAIPEEVGGVMMLAAIMHLSPDDRRSLLVEVAARLASDGSALIEVMQPWTATAIPRQQFVSVACGRHRIEGEMEATPFGTDVLDWTMTYRRVDADGAVLDEASGTSRCWVVDPDQFAAEATAAELTVEWLSDELVVLRP
ncbi:MAG: methyltransferase domain-containing protein [Actinomycetota bacterium]